MPTCPTEAFILSEHELKTLMSSIKILLGRILVEKFPQLSWIRKFLPTHITHSLSELSAKKNKVIALDLIDADEKHYEECYLIMKKAQEIATKDAGNGSVVLNNFIVHVMKIFFLRLPASVCLALEPRFLDKPSNKPII